MKLHSLGGPESGADQFLVIAALPVPMVIVLLLLRLFGCCFCGCFCNRRAPAPADDKKEDKAKADDKLESKPNQKTSSRRMDSPRGPVSSKGKSEDGDSAS